MHVVCVWLCVHGNSVLSVVFHSLCFELWTPGLHSKWFLPTEIYATSLLAAFNIKLLIKYFSLQDESSSTTNLCVEDLQKNKDSNSIIKDRLSQTVRQNSKSFFDPVRKCNGQPVPFQQPKHFTGGVMRWYQVEGMEWLRVMNYFLFLKKLYYYCVYVWVGVRTTTHVDIRKWFCGVSSLPPLCGVWQLSLGQQTCTASTIC